MIYFLQSDHDGPIKIGYSKRDINRRLRRIQATSPYQLSLLAITYGGLDDEAKLHKRFKKLNIHHEWFNPESELLEYIALLNKPLDIETFELKEVVNLKDHLQEIEKKYISRALTKTDGSITKAGILLGMSFRSMKHKIVKYAL